MADTWIDEHADTYEARVEGWRYVFDHLSGRFADPDAKLGDYLIKKEQGESDAAFRFRKEISDPTPHFFRAVIALAGMLFAVEDDAARSWGLREKEDEPARGLGDPEREGTIMSRLWENADGSGGNWLNEMFQAAIELAAVGRVWGLVEGIPRNDEGQPVGEASIRFIPATRVVDWVTRNGRPVEVMVQATEDRRTSVREKKDKVDRWHVYGLDGFVKYRKNDDGMPMVVESHTYGARDGEVFNYWASSEQRKRILPIFPVQLSMMPRMGYMMARKANTLFNMTNARDFHLLASAISRLKTPDAVQDGGSGYNADYVDALQEALQDGSAVVPGDPEYFAPPMQGAEERREAVADKRDEFYTQFFQSYGDAARERTATEIRQDIQSGVEAALVFLGSDLDEVEQAALLRLEQVYFPDDPEIWGSATVKRSDDFSSVDIEGRIQRLCEGVFGQGETVPLGTEARVEAAMRWADQKGLSPDEEEVRAEVEALMQEETSGLTSITDRVQRLQQRASGETPASEANSPSQL
jgi:hypothetical protein